MTMKFVYDDGGRAAAGFKGVAAGDCVCRAIAIATGDPYQEVYEDLIAWGKRERTTGKHSHPRTGIFPKTTRRYLAARGWVWHPMMQIGQGCTVHLDERELPTNQRLIVQLSRHVVAVIYSAVHDLTNPDRDGNRCVYGYWTREEEG